MSTATTAKTLPAPTRRPAPWVYARTDTLTTLLRPDMLFFTLVMPLGMFLIFGASQDYSEFDAGRGNVSAATMINMSTFSVAIAATCTAAGAAVEQASGWGRQVALTAGGLRTYIMAKLLTAFMVSVFPVTIIFLAGTMTNARMDAPWVWLASYGLALLAAIPFSCYGLAVGLWVPAQAAVGIAGASISIFAFLSNVFMPLGEKLFIFGRFTPMYGAGALGTRALQGDKVPTINGLVHEDLWIPVVNYVVWTLIFTLVCLAARRHVMARR